MGPSEKPSDTSLQEKTMAAFHSNARQPNQSTFREDLVAWLRSLKAPKAWVGLTAVTWARTFSSDLATRLASAGYAELSQHLNRQDLLALCKRSDVPLEYRVAAVMAWGRSNPRNPQNNRNLWASISNIAPLLKRLPELTRKQAFAEFQRLIARGALQGMRASFFTKLMFFFGCPHAYILDQWMAKAMLALRAANWRVSVDGNPKFVRSAGNFIRLGYGGTSIALTMSGDDYEAYCLSVEALVRPLGRVDGADVECWLFSDPTSEWRRFLKRLDWKLKTERL